MGHDHRHEDGDADDLLRRALLDPEAAAAVALKVDGLALADALTVVFHGRRDLGTIQTYVAPGHHGAGDSVGAAELLYPESLRPDYPIPVDNRDAHAGHVIEAHSLEDIERRVGAIDESNRWSQPVLDSCRVGFQTLRANKLSGTEHEGEHQRGFPGLSQHTVIVVVRWDHADESARHTNGRGDCFLADHRGEDHRRDYN